MPPLLALRTAFGLFLIYCPKIQGGWLLRNTWDWPMVHIHTYPHLYESVNTSYIERWEWALAPGLKEYSCRSLQIAVPLGTHHCTWHPVSLKRLRLSRSLMSVWAPLFWGRMRCWEDIQNEQRHEAEVGMYRRWWETCLHTLIRAY